MRWDPSLDHACQSPATLPGTPIDRQPSNESSVTLPSGPTYMLRVDRLGAVSRKSSANAPADVWATRNPPPPRFPAVGNATASANAVATAASTALPPLASTSTPTCVASAQSVVTMPRGERADGCPFGKGQSLGKLEAP